MKKTILLSLLVCGFIGCEIGDINEVEDESTTSSDEKKYVSPSGDDKNDGTSSEPWKTIQASIDKLEDDETLIVKTGIYNEMVLISGDEDSNIKIKGEDGAIIDGSGLIFAGRRALVGITNAHDVTVQNLELRNLKTVTGFELLNTPVGILINGTSSDINITENTIHDIANFSTCGESSGCGPGANGIAVYGDTTTTMTNLYFTKNEISNCILASSEAFTINGNINGFKVIDNYVHDNNNIGIDVIGYEDDVCSTCSDENNRARNGIIRNNRSINNSTNLALGIFNNNPWYEGSDGSAGGFYVDGGHHILFEGNYASQNDLGFEFASEHAGKASNDILMVNNFIYNNREVGLTLGGYSSNPTKSGGGDATDIMVYNNSFYKNAGWGSEIAFSYRVKDTILVNNIIYGEGNVSENFSTESDNQSKNITWGNNVWWAEDVSNREDIQGDAIVEDPFYRDASNGSLDINTSSPAVDVAEEQDDITSWSNAFWESEFSDAVIPAHGSSDIHGDKRIKNKLDMGADEV